MSHQRRQWTREEVHTLLSMRNKGIPAIEIAEHLNRSISSVLNRLAYPRHTLEVGSQGLAPPKPKHITASYSEPNNRQWYEQNNSAFVAAMLEHHPERETRLKNGALPPHEFVRFNPPRIDTERALGGSSMADMA